MNQNHEGAPKPALRNLAYALGTALGLGKAPVAPGTFGALGALPLHWLLRSAHPALYVASIVLVSGAGVWASQVIAEDRNEEDPGLVVIDEVAGALIALGLVRQRSVAVQLAAWALFRALDILKPGPIGKAEHLKPAGVGIMLDDLLAGAAAGGLARLL
jgi:phosphatidylglycerophosphatase A